MNERPSGLSLPDAFLPCADGVSPLPPIIGADPFEAALSEACALRDAGLVEPAGQRLRDLLALAPGHVEANLVLAELLEEQGHREAAALHYAVTADLDPGRSHALCGLARVQAAAGRLAEAVATWRRLLELRPESARAHREVAQLLSLLGEEAEAVGHWREAVFLDPGCTATAVSLAGALLRTGAPVAAVEAVQPLLRREPENAAALCVAARGWIALGEGTKAERLLRRCLDADPEDRFGAAGLLDGLDAAAAGLTPAYVRALFDGYAASFDGHLVERLGYRGPEILREAVGRVLPAGAGPGSLRVLDLGCGTGLAGLAFRDLARHLEGADLAPRMVARAEARGVYDRVRTAEFRDALDSAAAWDLVVAADVLVYLGDLSEPFAAVAAALAPGGLFTATTERCAGGGFVLGEGRRYAHCEDHLRRCAASAGLEPVLLEEGSIRRERGVPVPGFVLVLRKPPGAAPA